MITFTGEGLMAVEWTLIGIALILILARVNLRLRYLRAGFVVSDFFIFGAFACALTLTTVDTTLYARKVYEADVDFTMEQWDASDEERIAVYKTFFGLYYPFYLQQYCNKGTLIALYFEIFGQSSSKTRTSLFLLTGFCIIGFVSTVLMNLFYCKFGCFWSLEDPCPTSCSVIKDNMGWAFHFASDILIFTFPLVLISRLNMSKAQRISCGLTFGLGFINISITLARWFVVQSVFSPIPSLNVGEVLAISDGHSGLIVSILPALRPYLRIFRDGGKSWHTRLSSGRGSGSSTAGTSKSHTSKIRKETTTYQEISYPSVENMARYSLAIPDAFNDTRSIRTVVSVNGHIV